MPKNKDEYIKIFLIPLFIVTGLLIIPFFIDMWVENNANDSKYWDYVEKLLDYKLPVLWFGAVLLWILYFVVYIFMAHRDALNEYEQKSRDQAAILLSKNSALRKFELQKSIQIIMRKFVQSHSNVLAAQLYKYEALSESNRMMFKVTYYDGYVEERANMNGLLQHYYIIDKKLYKKYTNSINSDYNKILDFVIEKAQYFNEKSLFSIKKSDAMSYATMVDAYAILLDIYPDTDNINIEPNKISKLENIVKDLKRLSIFRGILVDDFYISNYQGSGDKQGRLYATTTIIINDEKMLLLIAIDSDLLNSTSEAKTTLQILEEQLIELSSINQPASEDN